MARKIIANRLVTVLGKRQRLAMLQLTVNQFPSGKHWRFDSSLPHERKHPFSHALLACEIILGYLGVSSKDLNCVTAGADLRHSRPRVFDRLVKWPRHHPFTVVTRVRISYRSFCLKWQNIHFLYEESTPQAFLNSSDGLLAEMD